MSDLDLLALEMDLLWGPDLFGRPAAPHPLVAIAVATDGHTIRFDPATPTSVRSGFEELVASGDFDGESPAPSHALDAPRRSPVPLRRGGGPSFVVRGDEVAPTARFRVLDSSGPIQPDARPERPTPWGDDAEWERLLEGGLGPWALALLEDRVVGVCYTPVASPQAAEAGVWTDPSARGQGCAPLVTAAWGHVARPRFGTLFYSTSFENAASQAVARKLGLRPLGEIRQLWRAE